jgi:transcriptional regulator with XRE-family HTH domain
MQDSKKKRPKRRTGRTELGRRLFDARRIAELSQTEAAKRLGMLPQTLCFLEHGRNGNGGIYDPSLAILRKMAIVYSRPLESLISRIR